MSFFRHTVHSSKLHFHTAFSASQRLRAHYCLKTLLGRALRGNQTAGFRKSTSTIGNQFSRILQYYWLLSYIEVVEDHIDGGQKLAPKRKSSPQFPRAYMSVTFHTSRVVNQLSGNQFGYTFEYSPTRSFDCGLVASSHHGQGSLNCKLPCAVMGYPREYRDSDT